MKVKKEIVMIVIIIVGIFLLEKVTNTITENSVKKIKEEFNRSNRRGRKM